MNGKVQELRDQLARINWNDGRPLDRKHEIEHQLGAELNKTTAEQQITKEEKDLDQPDLTPGTPHPDPYLAAKGWHVCGHGIYTRHPDGPLQPEPEAC
jgi:hypothetical protein